MTDGASAPGITACQRCGTPFVCGALAGEAGCWCATLPALPPPRPEVPGCLCPACLAAVRRDGTAAEP